MADTIFVHTDAGVNLGEYRLGVLDRVGKRRVGLTRTAVEDLYVCAVEGPDLTSR